MKPTPGIIPNPCPCGSGRAFANCCGPCLDGTRPPADAETLMRSRYSAYVLEDAAYLLASWHPRTRPASLELDREPRTSESRTKWLGLSVKRHERIDADHAVVEFVARYKIQGRAFRLHEVSRFERVDGRWLYLDGEPD